MPLKISIVSSILNHGKILQDSGSSLVLLSLLRSAHDDISVITWKNTSCTGSNPFRSSKIYGVFESSHTLSIFKYFKLLRNLNSDFYIFNLMPTAYGNSSIANFIGLIMPLFTAKTLKKNTLVIYHNSTFTNDPAKLGYSGFFNRVKYFVLRKTEKKLFTTVNTYFFIDRYTNTLLAKFPDSKVKTVRIPFFQVLDTLYLNSLEDEERVTVKSGPIPRILLFGSWGPQKNPREAMECLRKLRNQGLSFSSTLAGGMNEHFPNLNYFYDKMFEDFADVIDKRLQYVPEKELIELFTKTDLVIIPYNVPGGFSSVLALSIFFERRVMISDFPEYREQALDYSRINFYKEDELYDKVKTFIMSEFLPNVFVEVKIKERIASMVKEFSKMVEEQLQKTEEK
jgi:glycosyltransferase involved in cell wall biosynthesis